MKPEGLCPASGKVGYANEDGARVMLDYFKGQGRDLTGAYECRHCGNWHLTSMKLYEAGKSQRSPRQRVLTWLRLVGGRV